MITLKDAEAAGTLLCYGLKRNVRPYDCSEYTQLLDRYHSDSEFGAFLRALASGLQLEVLDAGGIIAAGLVLIPTGPATLFSMKLTDIRNGADPKFRQALGLLVILVTQSFFPTEAALEDPEISRTPVSMGAVFDEITRAIEKHRQSEELRLASDAYRDGWAVLSRVAPRLPDEQRANTKSIAGLVRIVLNSLTEEGLLVSYATDTDQDGESYLATPTYQVQLRDYALPKWVRLLKEHASLIEEAALALVETEGATEFVTESPPKPKIKIAPDSSKSGPSATLDLFTTKSA
jgi:hypothetical protein